MTLVDNLHGEWDGTRGYKRLPWRNGSQYASILVSQQCWSSFRRRRKALKSRGGMKLADWACLPGGSPLRPHGRLLKAGFTFATSTIDSKAQQGAHTKEAHGDESDLPPSPLFFSNLLNMIRNFQVRTQFRIKPRLFNIKGVMCCVYGYWPFSIN